MRIQISNPALMPDITTNWKECVWSRVDDPDPYPYPDSIGSVDPDPESGSRREKMTQKAEFIFLKVMF
jgi:hypothetical protein